MSKNKQAQRARRRADKERLALGIEQISPTICLVGRNVVTLNRTTGQLRCNCVEALRAKPCEHVEKIAIYARRRTSEATP